MAGYEHALFILLLLGFLLLETSGRRSIRTWLVAGGLMLVFLPPVIRIDIPWNLVFALTVPLIIWQNAQSWLHLEWRIPLREAALWLVTVISLTLIMALVGNLPWLTAIFFAIVASSLLWQALGRERTSNLLENFGSLTLIFLLVETSLLVDFPLHFLGRLIAGAGVGIILAFLSIAVVKKISRTYESQISLIQVYLAYWIAHWIGASAIAAALISFAIFAEVRNYFVNNEGTGASYTRVDQRFTFPILLALFIFTAWQTHQTLTLAQGILAVLSLCIVFLIAPLARRIGLPQFEHQGSVWDTGLRLGLFFFGILILWPHGPGLGSFMIWIALGSAISLPVLSIIIITALHDMNMQWNGNNKHPSVY